MSIPVTWLHCTELFTNSLPHIMLMFRHSKSCILSLENANDMVNIETFHGHVQTLCKSKYQQNMVKTEGQPHH